MRIFNFFKKNKQKKSKWAIAYHPELGRYYIKYKGWYVYYWLHLSTYDTNSFSTDCVHGKTKEEAEDKIQKVIAHWGLEKEIKITDYNPQ